MRVPSGWHTALRLWSRKDFSGVLTRYAVIATGGNQYRVEKGTVLKVEKLDAEPGATVSFGEVLLLADGDNIQVGAPLLKGGKVEAVVEKHGKGDKKVIVKFRRRKHYLRQGTHRQQYTQVKITGISA
jgi:large subunit ribosomal protein L21